MPETSPHPPAAHALRILGPCLVAMALGPPASLGGQIATDRPDFVESSQTVGAGSVQLETSLSRGRTDVSGTRTSSWSTPTLLRIGVGPVLELRVESEGWIHGDSEVPTGGVSGVADVAVGLKWHATDPFGGWPSTAVLLHADLPSGAASVRGDGVRPSLRAVAEWTLPAGLSAGVMPGVGVGRDGSDSFAVGVFGLVVGKELTGRLRSFGELSFDQIAADRHGGTQGTFNTGLALLLTHNVQADAAASWRVSGQAEDFRWGVGLSVLVPGAG